MSLNLNCNRSYSYKPVHLCTFLFQRLCYCLSAANTTLITGACGFGRASAATIVLSVNKKMCHCPNMRGVQRYSFGQTCVEEGSSVCLHCGSWCFLSELQQRGIESEPHVVSQCFNW